MFKPYAIPFPYLGSTPAKSSRSPELVRQLKSDAEAKRQRRAERNLRNAAAGGFN